MASDPSKESPATHSSEKVEAEKWGTHIMGAPAAPTVHPDNQKAAGWNAGEHQQIYQQPYIVYSPVEKPSNNPFEAVVHAFNSWSRKAEELGRNIWHNLKTGPSVSEAAWGKMNLTAKAMTEGGFESLFKQIFETEPNEHLKKTFACYLSTSTGPVAGTLYLSTARVAFCSDRPLSFMAPSGQQTWSYYKVTITFLRDVESKLDASISNYSISIDMFVPFWPTNLVLFYKIMIPLGMIGSVNPVVMKENPPEKYIQISTVDGHDFWFMGFVSFEKASHHLLEAVSNSRTTSV